MKLTPNQILQIIKTHQMLVFLPLTAFVLMALTIFSFRMALQTNHNLSQAHQEVTDLKQKVAAINANKIISQTDLENYNQILNQLIPDKEDYFSILTSLETL